MTTISVWLSGAEVLALENLRTSDDRRSLGQVAHDLIVASLERDLSVRHRTCEVCRRDLSGYVIRATDKYLCSLSCLEHYLNEKLATAMSILHGIAVAETVDAKFNLAQVAPNLRLAKGERILPVVWYDTNSKRRPRSCGHCGQPWTEADRVESDNGLVLVGVRDQVTRVSYHWKCVVPEPGALMSFRQELLAFASRWQQANLGLVGDTPIRVDGLSYDIVRV